MGLQIGDIVPRRALEFSELKGKTIAIDAFNALYQFLNSIRQPDGTPLMDDAGQITSHLSGLFYRNVALIAEGMKLIYVFDGEYNELKRATQEKRQEARDAQEAKFQTAKEAEDVDAMAKYARSSRLDSTMLTEAKELLEALGVAIVQAPGEGEMQAAELVKSGQAYAVGSQDYDALAVGGTRLVQNLTLARRRKTGSSFVYISPELIEFKDTLLHLGLDHDQLISLAILVGTDFNPGGVRGIGPKKALALVKDKKYPVAIFDAVRERHGELDFDWKTVFELFKKPHVHKDTVIFPKLNPDKVIEILVDRHQFSKDRVEKQLGKLTKAKRDSAQTTLF